MTLIAVCGLAREAEIVAGPGIVTVAGGGRSEALAARIAAAAGARGVTGVISIGVAGALDPALAVGDAVIATEVVADADRLPVDAEWAGRLGAALPDARRGRLVGSDVILAKVEAKADLRRSSGALAVDMESHVAARAAARLSLPFAALRFISDDASTALPPAALAAMRPDGGVAIGAVLASLARDPRQLPALLRTGRDAAAAFRALRRGRDLLGPALGSPEIEGL